MTAKKPEAPHVMPIDAETPIVKLALCVDLGKAYSLYDLDELTMLGTERIRSVLNIHRVHSTKRLRHKQELTKPKNHREYLDLENSEGQLRIIRVWHGDDIVRAAKSYLDRHVPKRRVRPISAASRITA